MSARRLLVLCAFALFGGASCRALVGIEDLSLDEDSGTAKDAAAEAGSAADGEARDTGAVDAGPADTGAGACVSQSNCRRCCRQTFGPALDELTNIARQNGCICVGPNSCTSECSAGACATPPQAPVEPCGPCLDDRFRSNAPECASTFAACRASSTCAAGLDCVQGCPQ